MPVELSIVETVTELETTVVEVVLDSSSAPGIPGPGVPVGGTTGQLLAKDTNADYDTEWVDAGAPGPHVTSHQDGGTDEISLTGLSGTPAALTTHEADTTNVHGIVDTSALVVDGDTAGGVLGGTYPNPSFAVDMATQVELDAHVNDATAAHAATAIAFTPDGSIAATTVQAAIVEVRDEAGGGGAPTDVDYLVGTASGGLSAEIVVGTSPGGELGGTWASPTVDAMHSGSTHAAVQAAAEATAAAALSAHLTDTSDAHDASAISITDAGNDFTATDVEGALAELQADHEADATALSDHIADTSAAHAASAISADSTTLVGTGTDVQAVLEELDNGIADHLADATDAHDASAISIADAGGHTSETQVEGALQEIYDLIDGLGGGSGIPVDGWIAAGETWTYASADDPTFTFTVTGVDLTGKYQPGMRVKLTQTTAKYFIITKVAFSTDTTITIYGGTDYDLANAAISDPYYSPVKAPFGFPLESEKWTHEATDTTLRTQASPSNGTWYNLGSFTLAIPIGAWRVYYEVLVGITNTGSDSALDAFVTLSTANNSESDKLMTARGVEAGSAQSGRNTVKTVHRERFLTLAAKTSYFLNSSVSSGGSTLSNSNDEGTAVIRAVCAYL